MRTCRRPARRFTAYAAFALVFMLAADATPSAQNNWRRIDTPNFVAIGEVSAASLRDVVLKFEGFRETLSRLHGPGLVGSAVPTIIIVFPTDYAMEPFRPIFNGKPVDVAGLCVPGRDVSYVSLVSDDNRDRLRVMFHEYTHLAASNGSRQLPAWLNEGMAEYYSTFEPIKGGREAIIGNVVGDHISRLNNTILIPIAELLKIDHGSPLYNEGSRRTVFYAESWALVHMLLRGEPDRSRQLAAYVDGVTRGIEPVAAWQEAFGGLNMDQELERYIRQQSFHAVKYSFGDAVARIDAAAVPMTPSDVQAFLADFQLELRNEDGAARRLADLSKRDPSSTRASVTAARLSMMRGQPMEIGDRLRAMAPPQDWFLGYLAGVTLADQVSRSGKPSTGDIAAVERLLAVARTSGREFPNAVASAADLELHADAIPSAEMEAALDRARKLAPGRDDFAFLHAQILVRRKEYAKARAVLGPLFASGPPNVRDIARRMLGTIAGYETEFGANAGTTGTIPPPAESAATVPPKPTSTPFFRQMKSGEQRLEAIFEKSECVTGKGITFYFKAGDQTVTATAAKFEDVDFITYRDDLTGTITCGPAKEPMRVYMTWRAGQTAGSKVLVAIEFLPKTPSDLRNNPSR